MRTADAVEALVGEIVREFERSSGLTPVESALIERSDGVHLLLKTGHPTNRYYEIINAISNELPAHHPLKDRIVLKKVGRGDWLKSPELSLLQKVLAESLTVGKNSFRSDFFSRYIKSVGGMEQRVLSRANHIVFGRRGAGKSSLLLYGLRTLEQQGKPALWISMQPYEHRSDIRVALEVLHETCDQAKEWLAGDDDVKRVLESLKGRLGESADPSENDIRRYVPEVKRVIDRVVKLHDDLFIFLDDFHVLSPEIQPFVLSTLYSCCRGGNAYLKLSAIETFTRNWDPERRVGLDTPHDAQVIKLDYNLTDPPSARSHVENILEAHTTFCGIPSLSAFCNSEVVPRLVWVAAGVPRDALNVLAQAIATSLQRSQKKVTVQAVNTAASQNNTEKLRYVSVDASSVQASVLGLLERIKAFCYDETKKNAFICRIDHTNAEYQTLTKLIDLRLLHVVSEAITPDAAGEKFIAVVLDYGFYVSKRSAKSIELFHPELERPKYEELRMLPRFKYASEK